jgi:hypothetical protein
MVNFGHMECLASVPQRVSGKTVSQAVRNQGHDVDAAVPVDAQEVARQYKETIVLRIFQFFTKERWVITEDCAIPDPHFIDKLVNRNNYEEMRTQRKRLMKDTPLLADAYQFVSEEDDGSTCEDGV